MKNCNEEECICPKKTCENHGKCCACVNNHRKKGNIVYCMREAKDKK